MKKKKDVPTENFGMQTFSCIIFELMLNQMKNHLIILHYVKWGYRLIVLVGRVFANGLGDLGSIPGCVIPKTLKMALDTSLPNTQHYKVHIKGKVEQSRERSNTLPLQLYLLYQKKEIVSKVPVPYVILTIESDTNL